MILSGKRYLLRFKEKGGKKKELPVHQQLEELLDQYLKATGLEKEPESPLFSRRLSERLANSRAGRSYAPMPRTCLKGGSNKLGCRRIIRLTPSGRPASRIFWKMTAPWKPLSGSPATPTAAPRNLTTAVRKPAQGCGEDSILKTTLLPCLNESNTETSS